MQPGHLRIATLAAGGCLILLALVWSRRAGREVPPGGYRPGDPLLLAGYGASLALRGAGLVAGVAELLVMGAGTACLGLLAYRVHRRETATPRGPG